MSPVAKFSSLLPLVVLLMGAQAGRCTAIDEDFPPVCEVGEHHFPGCSAPALPAAGCYAACESDTDCTASRETFQEAVYDPCHDLACEACGASGKFCLPRPALPADCVTSADCQAGSVCVWHDALCDALDPSCAAQRVCEPLSCAFASDCPAGSSCDGSSVCPPDMACFWAGEPGLCLPANCGAHSCDATEICVVTNSGPEPGEDFDRFACQSSSPYSVCDSNTPSGCGCIVTSMVCDGAQSSCDDSSGTISVTCNYE